MPLDTETGVLIFQMPAVSAQSVFVLTAPLDRQDPDARLLIACARDDGRELWRANLRSADRASPVTDGQRVFVQETRSRWQSWLIAWGLAGI